MNHHDQRRENTCGCEGQQEQIAEARCASIAMFWSSLENYVTVGLLTRRLQ